MRATLPWRAAALYLLPLLPVFYLLTLVAKYGVDVPYADEFSEVPETTCAVGAAIDRIKYRVLSS